VERPLIERRGFRNIWGEGIVFLVWLVIVGLLVFGLWRIFDAASAATPPHRTMEPSMIWLLLIPFFQVYWNFRALPAVSESLSATLHEKGLKPDDCGRAIGRVWALLVLGIYLLHVILLAAEGFLLSVGADGLVTIAVALIGLSLLLAWLAVFATIIIYVVKLQAAKSQIVAAVGDSSRPT
jgi:hypothetical protein